MATESKSEMSRRSFLKGTALGVAAIAGTGVLAGCAPKAATTSNVPEKWDKEVDVVVVGSGTVIFAALAAKDAGAESVLVLEKNVAFGGTSAISGGGFWIPMNYRMAEEGYEDNREDAYKYMKAVTSDQGDDTLINTYLDNAPKMVEWSRDNLGLKWYNNLEAQGNMNFQDYYELPGFRPFGRTIYFSKGEDPYAYGMPWQILRTSAEEMGIEILMETAAKDLFTNEAGEVIGVKAEGSSGTMTIKAKKGVVLGTGGFDHNKEMLAAFLRTPIYATNAVATNTGDGHLMAMKLGADLRNMQSYWGLPFYPLDEDNLIGEADWQTYRGKPGSIVVNKHGERIGNEAAAYHVFNRSFSAWDSGLFEWRNIPAYWIADSLFAQSWFFPGSNYTPGEIPDWIVQADTLEELCQKLGVDADGLNATLAVFNPNAIEGKDPVYHRGEYQFDLNTSTNPYLTDLKNGCLAPIATAPFYGAQYVPGTCGTNGGLHINENAQVIKVDGTPIPRLYAVGNTSGSVMGAAYPGGGSTLGAGGVFAYIAGRHVVGLEAIA